MWKQFLPGRYARPRADATRCVLPHRSGPVCKLLPWMLSGKRSDTSEAYRKQSIVDEAFAQRSEGCLRCPSNHAECIVVSGCGGSRGTLLRTGQELSTCVSLTWFCGGRCRRSHDTTPLPRGSPVVDTGADTTPLPLATQARAGCDSNDTTQARAGCDSNDRTQARAG